MSSALVNSAWFLGLYTVQWKKMECFYLIYDIWDIYETRSGFFSQ